MDQSWKHITLPRSSRLRWAIWHPEKKGDSEIRDLQRAPRALCDPGRSFVNRLQSRSHCGVPWHRSNGKQGAQPRELIKSVAGDWCPDTRWLQPPTRLALAVSISILPFLESYLTCVLLRIVKQLSESAFKWLSFKWVMKWLCDQSHRSPKESRGFGPSCR